MNKKLKITAFVFGFIMILAIGKRTGLPEQRRIYSMSNSVSTLKMT